jgi:hypothetical protein
MTQPASKLHRPRFHDAGMKGGHVLSHTQTLRRGIRGRARLQSCIRALGRTEDCGFNVDVLS